MENSEEKRMNVELNELKIEGYVTTHLLDYNNKHYFSIMHKGVTRVPLIDILNGVQSPPDAIIITGDLEHVYNKVINLVKELK